MIAFAVLYLLVAAVTYTFLRNLYKRMSAACWALLWPVVYIAMLWQVIEESFRS